MCWTAPSRTGAISMITKNKVTRPIDQAANEKQISLQTKYSENYTTSNSPTRILEAVKFKNFNQIQRIAMKKFHMLLIS